MELGSTLRRSWHGAYAYARVGVLWVAEAPGVYRPRRPEKTAFHRVIAGQFDRYVQAHEERFAPRAGPLRRVVPEAVAEYLDCGLLENGFARLRCASCGAEHLLAFSCRTRNFCPSCQAKRAAAFAEHLREEVALPVPHRHVTFTIPRALRGLFERDRSLLGLLARCAYEALRRLYQAQAGRKDAVPGVVASIQTFGSYLNFHPHVHALATEGVVAPDGTFVPVPAPDLGAVCELYRRLVLAELRRKERLSEPFHTRLLAWSPSGFSVFGEQVARADEPERLERLARYVTRAPFALDRVLVDGDAVGGCGGGASERRDEGRRRAGEPTLVGDDADGAADCGIDVEVAGHGDGRGGGRTVGSAGLDAGSGGRGATGPHRRDPAPDVPRVRVLTPPDPVTGRTVLELDALEFVHRVTTQIPDPRRHQRPQAAAEPALRRERRAAR